jgi:hypothetical protein
MLRRLYDWCIAAADKPYATWLMGIVSFVESSFFPVPPDAMLIPMSLARPDKARDLWISHIRLSDKTSRLHPRHVVPKPAQAYEPEVPVKVREWISPALASPGFVLGAQPFAP